MEIGKQSIRLEKPVYVESWASVVGKKEGEGPLAPFFDEIETDDQLGQDNWSVQCTEYSGRVLRWVKH